MQTFKTTEARLNPGAYVSMKMLVMLTITLLVAAVVFIPRWFHTSDKTPEIIGFVDAQGRSVDMPFEFGAVLQKDKDGKITAPAGLNIKPVVRDSE